MTATAVAAGRWTRAERLHLSGVVGVVALMHVAGWSMYAYYAHSLTAATTFAGTGTLAYGLGVRHAFDADHIAVIDDTTRLMLQRGRRPVGVGFFFAMGHSSVVLLVTLVVAVAAGAATDARAGALREYGTVVASATAAGFLLLVAALNATVLVKVVGLWRRMTSGSIGERDVELALLDRGLTNRVLGGRARALVRSSWHMFPVGLLFGLGLETASEVALLVLSANAAASGALPLVAVLTLPLLFAAGMSAFDTVDGLLMTRAYSWGLRSPARRLYYNATTTAMTVLVATFVGTVYLAGLLVDHVGAARPLAGYASIGDRFDVLGYAIVGVFVVAWLLAALTWRLGGMDRLYGRVPS